jgi:hypothetical protein
VAIAAKGTLNHLYCPWKYRIDQIRKLWGINARIFVIGNAEEFKTFGILTYIDRTIILN